MLMEIWKDIVGYEGLYQISNYGRVKSFKRYPNGKVLTFGKRKRRYVLVLLRDKPSHRKYFLVNRLVAEAFIPNPKNLPETNHIDGNPANNYFENLEWCTEKYNTTHRHYLHPELCKGENNSRTQLTNDQALSIYYLAWTKAYTMETIGSMFGIKRHVVRDIKMGKNWSEITEHPKY
jgi:hypothetical protein